MTSSADDSPSLLTRILHGRWVGRVREMAEATSLWQLVASGEGQVLLIHGESGVGKTRFVRELTSISHLARANVLTGVCYPEGSAPYAPIAQIIQEVYEKPTFSQLGLPEEVLRDLLGLVPSLLPRFSTDFPNPIIDPEFALQRVFESFFAFLSALSAQSPLLLFIDDVHWADTGTLFLLRNLARRVHKMPVLLAMTYREAELESATILKDVLLDLNRERLALELKLARLSRDETRALLAAMFAEEITPEFLDGIYNQTEGNPFFVEEVCKALIESGDLSFQDGKWHRPAMTEIKIPQTIRSAIQARVQKLPAHAQETLRMAAVLGGEFDFETLRGATGLDEETLITALEIAVRALLVVEVQPRPSAAPRLGFAHVLIPTTLRESIIHVRRQRYHQRAAQAIEAVHPDDFEMLAYHYSEAGDHERARQYNVRAGDRAQQAAPGDAASFYRAALDRWPSVEQSERAEVLARLGYCLWVIGDVENSLKSYEAASSIFDQLGNSTQGGEMQRMIGLLYWERADTRLALEHYHQALAILERGPETVELARAISSISQMYMVAHEDDQAIAWGKRALALAERLGAEDVVVHALNNIGSSHAQDGDFDRGLGILQESLQRALAAGFPQDICRAYYNRGVGLQRQCHYQDAKDLFEELHAYAIRVYAKNYANLALWRLVWISWSTGQWGAAFAYRAKMVEFSNDLFAIWAKRIFALINLDLGAIEAARGELEESLPIALKANEAQTTAPHLGQLARAYDALGLEAQTAETINQILGFISPTPYLSPESIVPLSIACRWLAAQSKPGSLEKAHGCLSYLERLLQKFQTGEAAAELGEAEGSVLEAEGHLLEAVEQFRQSSIGWKTIDRPYDQARVLGHLGRVLITVGDSTAASAAYHQAFIIFDSLSIQLDAPYRATFLETPVVREVRRAEQALGQTKQRNITRQDPGLLTNREVEVLKLVAQGLTNAQIAERLVLSPLTVNAHLRSIFNKLDVTTRTAAVHQAIERGIV
jgi:DNA-binding CsgD family transcriptional regulator